MNFRGTARRRGAAAAIDITPLIDVVFNLLIFLLVSTTFKTEEYAFVVDLPTSSADQVTVTTDKTTVFLAADGSLHLLTVPGDRPSGAEDRAQATPVSPEELRARLAELYGRRPDAGISVRGEKDTSYQRLMDVVTVIQDVGFRQIWFPYEHGRSSP